MYVFWALEEAGENSQRHSQLASLNLFPSYFEASIHRSISLLKIDKKTKNKKKTTFCQ